MASASSAFVGGRPRSCAERLRTPRGRTRRDSDHSDNDDEDKEKDSGKKKEEDVEQVASASAASGARAASGGPSVFGSCVAWLRCRVVGTLDDVPGDEPFRPRPPPWRQSRKYGCLRTSSAVFSAVVRTKGRRRGGGGGGGQRASTHWSSHRFWRLARRLRRKELRSRTSPQRTGRPRHPTYVPPFLSYFLTMPALSGGRTRLSPPARVQFSHYLSHWRCMAVPTRGSRMRDNFDNGTINGTGGGGGVTGGG